MRKGIKQTANNIKTARLFRKWRMSRKWNPKGLLPRRRRSRLGATRFVNRCKCGAELYELTDLMCFTCRLAVEGVTI